MVVDVTDARPFEEGRAPFLPLRGRMKWAIVALVAVAVLDLAGFVSFLVSTWVDNIAARFAFSGDSASDIRSADLAQLFSDVFDLIAAVLAIVVIRAVTARQSERAVAVSSG